MSIPLILGSFKFNSEKYVCVASIVLCQKAVIKKSGEYFIARFEGASERASNFRGADPFAIADRHFTRWDSLFCCFELHLNRPSEGFILHIQRKKFRIPNCSKGTQIRVANTKEVLYQEAGEPIAESRLR